VPPAILWWTAACAASWSRTSGLRGTTAYAATIAVTAVAFAWWFDWWGSLGRLYVWGNPDPAPFPSFYPSFPHTPTMEVIAALSGPVINLGFVNWGIGLTAALWILSLITVRARSVRRACAVGAWIGCVTVASIIFVTIRAHSWIGYDGLTATQNYVIYRAWIYGILLCAAVAAAVIAGLRGGNQAAPAMAAAGITATLGSAGMVVTSGSDGCVGALAVANQQCILTDGMYWGNYSLIFEMLLPMLGMLTLVAGASAAGIIRMATSQERRQRTRPDPSPNPPAPRLRQPLRGRMAWTGSCSVCLLLAGLSISAYISTRAQGPSTASGGQGQTEPLASGTGPLWLQADELAEWNNLGGQSIILRLEDDANKLAALNPNGSADKRVSENMCSAIKSLTADAQAYLLPPNTLTAQSWSAAIGEASSGAGECLAGIIQHDSSLTTSGIAEIYDADHTLINVSIQIKDDVYAWTSGAR
jgi:hypothetical protein